MMGEQGRGDLGKLKKREGVRESTCKGRGGAVTHLLVRESRGGNPSKARQVSGGMCTPL